MNFLSNLTRSQGDPRVIKTGPSSLSSSDRLTRGLGWFSLGLGLTQVIAPARVAQWLGMRGKESVVRACGVREIGSGLLTLSIDKRAGLASRVAGDGLDIALLLSALAPANRQRGYASIALAVVGGVALLDIAAAQAQVRRHSRVSGPARDYRDRSGFPKGVESARKAWKAVVGSPLGTHGTPNGSPEKQDAGAGKTIPPGT
ncbi:hypothetical protein [Allorhizobium taibaishanense]|uniref:Cyclase dehydrase n=1 Tax=Allorhizobium taibaishanense TaxID=887144 RepID=A0A1Q9A7I0_9HYPH|nr:hypothetical protein [Allorhizobium taibaishanense]MBB4008284.1 hypothetical protein [Allorhizobium taibaishanense]OLP50520.1 hypothetical protein BJF91_14685 [Allorhizobium taibaishanense]